MQYTNYFSCRKTISDVNDFKRYLFTLYQIISLLILPLEKFFFYLGLLSQPFTNHKSVGERDGHFLKNIYHLPCQIYEKIPSHTYGIPNFSFV